MMLTKYLRPLLPLLTIAIFTTTLLSQTAPSTVTFSGQTFNTGPEPSGVVSGDFNEDGRPDLAVTDNLQNAVQILLNDGNGHFSLGSRASTFESPSQIVVGNFNGDTHLDLAVLNQSASSLTVLLGNGDGTFTPSPIPPSFPGFAAGILGANLRNDGLTQLVVSLCTLINGGFQCFLDVFQPDKQGFFSLAQSISVPLPAENPTMVSDDFDLDNKPDIAIGLGEQMMVFRNTSAFDGKGSANLTLLTSFLMPNLAGIASVTSGHFNAGAGPDLAIEVIDPVDEPDNVPQPHSVNVFLNQGKGTFFLKQTINLSASDSTGHQFAVTDVNGDGIQDLVSLRLGLQQGLEYFLGRGDGTFGASHAVAGLADGRNQWMTVRDMNRDSRHDIIVAAEGVDLGPNDAFTEVMLNQNALANCPSPGSDIVRVKICSATPGTNSLTVKAAGNSPSGVKRVELWIDGTKRTQAFSDQFLATVAVASGEHRVTLVAVDLYDTLAKQAITVTVP
jgi:hypothetical protein